MANQSPADAVDTDARYAGGTSATSGPARIELAADGLRVASAPVSFGGAGPHEVWPFSGLSVVPPIRAGDGAAVLRHADFPGAVLFVQNAALLAELTRRAPRLAATTQRLHIVKRASIVTALAAATAMAVWAFDLSPARGTARAIPDSAWAYLGDRVLAQVKADQDTCAKADGRAALDKMMARLGPVSGAPQKFEVHVSGWSLVNAFALPGRHVVITRGLLAQSGSPEELAGVIAHEIGHGLEQHPETGLVRGLAVTGAATLVLSSTTEFMQAMSATLVQMSYSRAAEAEADRHALQMLRQAHISPRPFATFFERLDKEHRQEQAQRKKDAAKRGIGGWLRDRLDYFTDSTLMQSHPAPAERASAAAAAATGGKTEPLLSAPEWAALKSICKGGSIDIKS